MSDLRQQLGLEGERLAERRLRQLGYRTLARRFSAAGAEIDLIMRDGDTVVFVEVKTQRDDDLLDPHERVNRTKQRRLSRAARAWLARTRREHLPCRFDIVAVVRPATGAPRVHHIPGALVPEHW